MQIFDKEKEDGLELAIASSFGSPVQTTCTKLPKDKFKTQASIGDDDLYHSYSLLVSSNWNDNDDVFLPEEVMRARKTPIYKRSNIEHDENQICGVMINAWAVRDDYSIIDDDDDDDELPDLIHLIVEDVIYTEWSNEQTKSKILNLINDIENDDMSVSMECLFYGFDYAVLAPDGTRHILARNEDTSFLSKHLRRYGGSGSYQNHKLGRVLRNIVFSGKGYTKNPANKPSMILTPDMFANFTKATKMEFLDFFTKASVHDNVNHVVETNDNNGSEKMDLEQALAAIESAKQENEKLAADLAAAQQENTKLVNELEVANKSVSDSQNRITELETLVASSNDEVNSLKEANASLASELDTIKAAQVKAARINLLVTAGVSRDEAENYVEKFANLAEDQFSALAEVFTLKVKNNEVITSDTVTLQATASEEIVDEVVVEETVDEVVVEETITTETVTTEEEKTVQASLADWAKTVFNKKK